MFILTYVILYELIYYLFIIAWMDNDLFTIQIYYDGSIKYHPYYHYSGGSIRYFDNCDLDGFSIIELEDMLGQLGYMNYTHFYYLIPRCNFENSLRKLRCDANTLEMLVSTRGIDVVQEYLEH